MRRADTRASHIKEKPYSDLRGPICDLQTPRPENHAPPLALKSSGETLSRNSRNFSTSSSFAGAPSPPSSSGISRPASVSTSSSAMIGTSDRRATAIESDGRAETRTLPSKTISA